MTDRLIRVRVPAVVFDSLKMEALEIPVPLAVLVRKVLVDHVQGQQVSEPQIPAPVEPEPEPERWPVRQPTPPSDRQWAQMNKWLAASGRSPDPNLVLNTKADLYQWAVSQGFKP